MSGVKLPVFMRPYAGIFKMRLIAGMQYRAAAWAGVATQFFWGGIQLLVFFAFYRSAGYSPGNDGGAPMTFRQTADYIWMRQAFLQMVMLWAMDNELLEHIATGGVAYELARPLSLYGYWFFRVLAFRLSRTLLRCFPIFIVALLLPSPWGFRPPPDLAQALLFVPALGFACLISAALSMLICLLTFYTLSPYGARLFFGTAAEFLMGALIPIPLMPAGLQRALDFLPFRYTADYPFRVWSGNITGNEALSGLCIQVFWLFVITAAGAAGFSRAQKRIVIQGG